MKRAPRGRLGRLGDGEAGLTLVELLVAAAMSVILVGAATSMLISAVRDQPQLSTKAQNVTTARWQLERIVREIRNGVSVTPGRTSAGEVSFVGRVRRQACGGEFQTSSEAPAIECQITYTCTTASCTRVEAEKGMFTGAATPAVTGIDDAEVFCFVPSAEEDPTECGPAKEGVTPTYIGVNLKVPNPSGSGKLTISDGASLRGATFSN